MRKNKNIAIAYNNKQLRTKTRFKLPIACSFVELIKASSMSSQIKKVDKSYTLKFKYKLYFYKKPSSRPSLKSSLFLDL